MIGPFFSPENLISFGGTPQPQPNLPTGVTPITPQPTLQPGILDFKTYDLDKPGGLVNQKNIPIPKMGPFTPASAPSKNKNDRLALMLYALGGALRGDKNFMQNTLRLQQMQEGKKKQEELEKVWEAWKDKNLDTLPKSIRDLTDIVTAEQGIDLAIKTATTPPEKITTDRIRAALFKKINDYGYNSLTPNEKETLAQIQNLDPYERRTRGLSRFPGMGTENDIQSGYIDTGETTADGKKIFKDKDGNRFVDPNS